MEKIHEIQPDIVVGALRFVFLECRSSRSSDTLHFVRRVQRDIRIRSIYPKTHGERMPFNFHGMRRVPKDGEKINYFVFKPSADVFKFMKSLSKNDLSSRLEPCSRGIDQTLSDRAQTIGGFIQPILGRADLLPYLKRKELIETDGYVYAAIDSNLRNYVTDRNDFGWEWLAAAAEKQQLCLYIGVGRMGLSSAMASVPINVSRLAKFTFVDEK